MEKNFLRLPSLPLVAITRNCSQKPSYKDLLPHRSLSLNITSAHKKLMEFILELKVSARRFLIALSWRRKWRKSLSRWLKKRSQLLRWDQPTQSMGPHTSAYTVTESLPPKTGGSMTSETVQSNLTFSIKRTTSITAKSAMMILLREMNS